MTKIISYNISNEELCTFYKAWAILKGKEGHTEYAISCINSNNAFNDKNSEIYKEIKEMLKVFLHCNVSDITRNGTDIFIIHVPQKDV